MKRWQNLFFKWNEEVCWSFRAVPKLPVSSCGTTNTEILPLPCCKQTVEKTHWKHFSDPPQTMKLNGQAFSPSARESTNITGARKNPKVQPISHLLTSAVLYVSPYLRCTCSNSLWGSCLASLTWQRSRSVGRSTSWRGSWSTAPWSESCHALTGTICQNEFFTQLHVCPPFSCKERCSVTQIWKLSQGVYCPSCHANSNTF